MANSLIVIVGGASFDSVIKDFFANYNLNIEHYNARKGADLRKQTIPKNTLGVIITVDRSHMAFGNSNEFTRYLVSNDIPYVFSGSNLASLNSSKILLQKIFKKHPEIIDQKENISEKEQKLEAYKQEWEASQSKILSYIYAWLEMCAEWEEHVDKWKIVLDEWKLNILEWKEIQKDEKFKNFKKRLGNNFSYIMNWKEEVHQKGIEIEKEINVLDQWHKSIEDSFNELSKTQEKLKNILEKVTNLNDKSMKAMFREWKSGFYTWKQDLELWIAEFKEWGGFLPHSLVEIIKWEEEIKLWRKTRERNII